MSLFVVVSTNKVYVDFGLGVIQGFSTGQVFDADPSLPTMISLLRANPVPIVPFVAPNANFVDILTPGGTIKGSVMPFGVTKAFVGLAAPGAVTLAGATVGQKVFALWDTAGAVSGAQADFETTISVNGQIQQIAGGDLSLSTFIVILV